jgi:nucleotide-binding universal stress UspA family protein
MATPFKVLVATDGSEHSRASIAMLRRLPLPKQVEVTLLCVAPKLDPIHAEYQAEIMQLGEEAKRIVSDEAKELAQLGWRTQKLVREGHAAKQIVDTAHELACNLVVVGSHGMTGISRFLLGSVAQKVVKYADCSVMVVRVCDESARDGTRDAESSVVPPLRLLLAYDGSEPASTAVKLLSSWPLRDLAEVTVLGVHAVTTTFYRVDVIERASELWERRNQELHSELEVAAEQLRIATPQVNVVLRENGPDPSREILESARRQNADLIVVGHKGKSAIEQFLMGSVSNRVVRHSDRSVLVVRP